MNLASVKFTAPVIGTYFFSLYGVGYMGYPFYSNMLISLRRNNGRFGSAEVHLDRIQVAVFTLTNRLCFYKREKRFGCGLTSDGPASY
jgi:hypothetical protein